MTKPLPVKRVFDDIYQFVLPFPEFRREEAYDLRYDLEAHPRVTKGLPYVLPYLITSRGETLLVDCGWSTEDSYGALVEQMQTVGLGVEEIGRLLITHAHPDHFGMAGRLHEEAGCDVIMHEIEIDFIVSRYREPEKMLPMMGEWLRSHGVDMEDEEDLERGSMAMRFFVQPVTPNVAVKGGETLSVGSFEFEVIWTPGHSPGHVCLYERNHRLLLTGDHVLPTISPNVSLHPQQRPNPLQDFLDSLEKIAHLDVDRVLPAHEWDIDWFKKRIDELRYHHEERLEEMRQTVAAIGDATATQVARQINWNTGSYDSFHAWMKRAAIGETLAHLRYLAGQGRLREFERDGVSYFQA
jgi:glyoxylase-like metal-dependent hydrolase (beta-lactamase superfamily II)